MRQKEFFMIDNPHIGKGILALLLAAILALLGFMGYWSAASAQMGDGLSMTYQNTLFDTSSVIEVDIDISEDNWAALLENATSEEYYDCDVTVNGTTYEHVGLRAKGNTSLSMVASSDSDRYSFKIKFDEYVDGQSCDGLSKLVLNNNYSDATMMKEALCYDMFAFLGANASLYNYAKVSVNGEYRGVYLALEPVEESFAIRNYGTGYGQLYKPDSMEIFVNAPEALKVTSYPEGSPVDGKLYDFSYLEKKDKYSMFMGGNCPLHEIVTGAEGKPSLLIIRDSYTDSLIPFLLEDYSEIHVLDLRYYRASLKAYIEQYDFDQVLVCYSVSNFSTDANIFLLGL